MVRLLNLNQSLWLDESIVARVVRTIPFHLIPTQFSPGDFHPPLYYMFVSLWSIVFGSSEVALRMPSILFSLIAGWYVYRIGVVIKNKTLGIWAAAFFLFNPLIIYYSQEARMYMMATMFLTIALYYFVQIHDVIPIKIGIQKRTKNSIDPVSQHGMTTLFNVFSFLAMVTFYGSAFFIAAIICIAGALEVRRNGKKVDWLLVYIEMGKMSIGLLAGILLLSPLLLAQLSNARTGLVDVKNWNLALGNADLKNVAMIFPKFATGRISWFPKWSYYLVSGIPTVIIWLSVIIGAKKNKSFLFLLFLPLLFGLFISFWAPMMMYFRFLYLIPVMSILLALSTVNNKKMRNVSVTVFLFFSLLSLCIPQFQREDWKGMSQELDPKVPLYIIVPSSDPITYYRSDISIQELRNINKYVVPETIDVVPYTSEIYGLQYVKLLQEVGCMKQSQMNFRGDVILEKWKCLRNA